MPLILISIIDRLKDSEWISLRNAASVTGVPTLTEIKNVFVFLLFLNDKRLLRKMNRNGECYWKYKNWEEQQKYFKMNDELTCFSKNSEEKQWIFLMFWPNDNLEMCFNSAESILLDVSDSL
jgi:hypothetical protein